MRALKSWKARRQIAPYLFILPFFITFAIFMLYPFIYSVIISCTEWNGIGVDNIKWIRLENYYKLFQDSTFLQSLANGVILYFMYVPVLIVLSILLAVLLNSKWLKGSGFFRSATYIPNITSTVAAAYIFSLIFSNSENGIINLILGIFGIGPISWFSSATMARIALCLLMIWRWLGYDTILMMAGLNAINGELNEAAEIDGASKFQIFIRITLPLMKNSILFTCIMSTIGTFSMFTEPKILTQGGPINTTMSTVLYLYNTNFKFLKMGYASAMAVVYFILMLVFTLIQMKIGGEKKERKEKL